MALVERCVHHAALASYTPRRYCLLDVFSWVEELIFCLLACARVDNEHSANLHALRFQSTTPSAALAQ